MTTTTAAARAILTPTEVADWLGVTVRSLAQWRYMGSGPTFTRLGRMIRYERDMVEAFIDAGRVSPAT